MKRHRIAKAAFIGATLFLVFLWGFVTRHYYLVGCGFLVRALDQGQRLVEQSSMPPHHMHRPTHDLVGVVAWGRDGRLAAPPLPEGEYVLVSSYFPEIDWRPGMRLMNRAGRTVHTWDVDITRIWPDPPPGEERKHAKNRKIQYVHGSYLFENGDVLFNVEHLALVRMNAAGEVLWVLDRHTHHSIQPTEDGNFWVCEARHIHSQEEVDRRFKGLRAPLFEDRVLEVSPEGEILREISVLEVLYRSRHRGRLCHPGPESEDRTSDLLHLNKVEPLPSAIAASYPRFEAGDLVVSLRALSLVMVFDPDTLDVRWALAGTVLQQHDPDFIGDGWISLFDNNTDGTREGLVLGGSRIVAVRPHTDEWRQIYPSPSPSSDHERTFYALMAGKCQRLPDNHWMITDATAGRVFEIDGDGRTVWEWGQEHVDGGAWICEVLEGTVYHLDPEKVRSWARP